MGKRKRRADHNKTPPPTPLDLMPYSSQMDSLSKEKSSRSVGTSAVNPLSSIMEIVDSSMKLPNAQLSPAHRHYHNHLSRTVLLRHPRHYYGRQYSRRNSANHAADTSSTSHHRKGSTPLRDDKQSFKLATPFNIESASLSDSRERASRRPERIRSSSSAMDAASLEVVKMVCGLCHKLLKRKPYVLESTLSSSDVSVVAVLVCGHAYHADCLETRTRHEDRRDPPCPLCLGQHSHSGPPGGQE